MDKINFKPIYEHKEDMRIHKPRVIDELYWKCEFCGHLTLDRDLMQIGKPNYRVCKKCGKKDK